MTAAQLGEAWNGRASGKGLIATKHMRGGGCPISRRSAGVPPFLVMEVLERAQALEREGREIIHLEVCEPDFETPAPWSAFMTSGAATWSDGCANWASADTV